MVAQQEHTTVLYLYHYMIADRFQMALPCSFGRASPFACDPFPPEADDPNPLPVEVMSRLYTAHDKDKRMISFDGI